MSARSPSFFCLAPRAVALALLVAGCASYPPPRASSEAPLPRREPDAETASCVPVGAGDIVVIDYLTCEDACRPREHPVLGSDSTCLDARACLSLCGRRWPSFDAASRQRFFECSVCTPLCGSSLERCLTAPLQLRFHQDAVTARLERPEREHIFLQADWRQIDLGEQLGCDRADPQRGGLTALACQGAQFEVWREADQLVLGRRSDPSPEYTEITRIPLAAGRDVETGE